MFMTPKFHMGHQNYNAQRSFLPFYEQSLFSAGIELRYVVSDQSAALLCMLTGNEIVILKSKIVGWYTVNHGEYARIEQEPRHGREIDYHTSISQGNRLPS
jgi:hypothetical protein